MTADLTDESRILAILHDGGELSVSDLAVLRRFMAKWQTSGYEAILETNLMSEEAIADALAELLKIERVFNVRRWEPQLPALSHIAFSLARAWQTLPLGISSGKLLRVAVADPTRHDRLTELSQASGCEIILAVGERSDILKAIDQFYPVWLQLNSTCATQA